MDRVVRDRFDENRTALAAIRHKPPPEVSTLARSSYCSPSTADEREVQQNDRVCCTQPDLNYVIRPQVTIHNPSLFRDKPFLDDHPMIARCCDKSWSPEDLVKLYHRKPRDLT
jgi:hypothetical protein